MERTVCPVSAVNTWCHHWTRHEGLFHCDNSAVVDIWRKELTHYKKLMTLVHLLYFVLHGISCTLWLLIILCISTINNAIACVLSQLQMQHFRSLAPEASPLPDPMHVLPVLSQLQNQCQSLEVVPSACCVYQSGLNASYNFCEKYKICPLSKSSLTLQFFCVDVSSQVS